MDCSSSGSCAWIDSATSLLRTMLRVQRVCHGCNGVPARARTIGEFASGIDAECECAEQDRSVTAPSSVSGQRDCPRADARRGRRQSTIQSRANQEDCASRATQLADRGQVCCARYRLRAAQPSRELPHVELVHLVLQRAQRNSKVLGGAGDVPAALLERSQDEVALERVGRVLEQAVGRASPAARAGRSGTRAADPLRRCIPCR